MNQSRHKVTKTYEGVRAQYHKDICHIAYPSLTHVPLSHTCTSLSNMYLSLTHVPLSHTCTSLSYMYLSLTHVPLSHTCTSHTDSFSHTYTSHTDIYMSHGTHAQILVRHVADTERSMYLYHARMKESLHTYTHVTESRHRHRVVGSHTCERPAAHIDTDTLTQINVMPQTQRCHRISHTHIRHTHTHMHMPLTHTHT